MKDAVERYLIRARTRGVRIMGWCGLIFGGINALVWLTLLIARLSGATVHSDLSPTLLTATAGYNLVVSACLAVVGFGLLRFREWARQGAIGILIIWPLLGSVRLGIDAAQQTSESNMPNPILTGLTYAIIVLAVFGFLAHKLIRYLRTDRIRAFFSTNQPHEHPHLP